MLEINKIYNEDCLLTMARMPDNFLDLVVTSPPYDNLRTYKGYTFEFEKVAKELFRVVKLGGAVVWVVGDETKDFCESLNSFKQALFFNSVGFNLLDTMIYHKSNYAPAYPSMRRYANTFEYMFVFSRGRPNAFNPIQVEKIKKTGVRHGKYRQSDGTFKEKDMSFDNGRDTKDAENVWTVCPTKEISAGNHPAVFPEQLAKDHILSWSNPGDLVYDPFMGSGTTAKMAIQTGRKFIGSEISKEYCDIAEKRISETTCILY